MAIDPQMLAQVLRTPESRDVTESPIVRVVILTDAANVADLVPFLERPDTLEAYNARRISGLFDATAISPLLTRLLTAGPNARKEGIEILWAILSGEEARTVRQVLTSVQDELDILLEDTQPIPDQMPDHIERDFRGRICDLAYIAVQLMLSPEFDQSLFRSLDDQGRNNEIKRFKTRALAPASPRTNKQTMKRVSLSLPLILLLAISCLAQEPFETRVDAYIKSEMQAQQIPGLSLAVIKDGRLVLAKGYGLANVEHQVPVKPETIFQSGSMGKQFTATAVMMLVEEGKLSLDDQITKYFPDGPEAWRNITVRHLLTHTSGMTDYPQDFDMRRDYTEDELFQRIKTVPLAFQPGEKWSYSNLAYVMLGILIHKVSGKFYGDFLQERIFKPLEMSTARVISEADMVPNRAAGYRVVNDQLKNQNWVSPSLNTTADGALYLTIYDMAKWDAALYTEKLLKKSSLEQMWTPVKLNDGKTHPYGFGWALGEVRGHRIVEHGGAWQGFKSQISRYPDDKLTVVLFANQARTNQAKIAHGVAAIFNAELR